MTISSNNNNTDDELSLGTSSSVPTGNKLTQKELLLKTSLFFFPPSSALSESLWSLKLQSLLPLLSSQKRTDCNDGNLVSSEGDDGRKEDLSEACLAYGLMIDAILVMVPTGKEMPAADGGMLRSPHVWRRSGGGPFRDWGRLLWLSMN